MATNDHGVPDAYYEAPNSLLGMNDSIFGGLVAIGCLATVSVIFTSGLLSFINWRMIVWKSHYTSFIGRNQPIVLIYQLILADFLQSLGFLISFHWAANRSIMGPNGECFAQGWLIQLGDVASAFFVLAIAVHTTYQVMFSRSVSYTVFFSSILGIWAFAVLLTSLAPIIGGRYVFMRAGMWCWISSEHDSLRLLLHYLWIFIVQFSSILVYLAGFYHLYRSKRNGAILINGASDKSVRKASTAMLAYALVYTVLTLPLAAGRMAAMSSDSLSDSYYLFAGALFTSSGWVDVLLYAITRRTLLFRELTPEDHQSRQHLGKSANSQIRQGSTDSILAQAGFGSSSGIVMDRTVKVELDDLESRGSSTYDGKSYFVSAKAVRK